MATLPPRTIVFAIWGPIAREDLPGCVTGCARCWPLRGRPSALCDVTSVAADAVTVDALARLQLAAKRSGYLIRLRGASDDLSALVAFMGLQDVLSPRRRSVLEPRRQSPTAGTARSVREKERHARDLPLAISSTWSAHGSWPLPDVARLVLAEGDRAVGAHGDDARAAHRCPGRTTT